MAKTQPDRIAIKRQLSLLGSVAYDVAYAGKWCQNIGIGNNIRMKRKSISK